MLVGLPSQRLLLPIIGAAAFLAFLGLLSFQQRLSVSAVSAADASFANSPYEQKLNRYRTGQDLPAAVPHDALKKVSMTSDECEATFPGYAKELERLMWLRDEKISSVEIDQAELEVRKGGVESWARVLVWDGKVCVILCIPSSLAIRLVYITRLNGGY